MVVQPSHCGVSHRPTVTANDPYLLPVLIDSSAVFTLLSMQNTPITLTTGSGTLDTTL